MRLVKLDAIDSTNDFLKALSNTENLANFTVVTAENQTKGRGQMGAVWNSETGKNLIMSVLVKDFLTDANQLFAINVAFATAVIATLESLQIPDLSVKWPNDILSGNKKIGGILIENSIKSDRQIVSVIGLGLNVNQTHFENLPKASSLALVCSKDFDKDQLLVSIIENFERKIVSWPNNGKSLWSTYNRLLFKKGVPMPFEDGQSNRFMGIIQEVSALGKLRILKEDDTLSEYGIKEIQLLY